MTTSHVYLYLDLYPPSPNLIDHSISAQNKHIGFLNCDMILKKVLQNVFSIKKKSISILWVYYIGHFLCL